MKKKWYLQTWFIGLLFFFSAPIIVLNPIVGFSILILGIVLIVIRSKERKKLLATYGTYDDAVANINNLNEEFANKSKNLDEEYLNKETSLKAHYREMQEDLSNNLSGEESKYNQKLTSLKQKISDLSSELNKLNTDILVEHYNFTDYENLFSEECKNKLAVLKTKEQALIKSGEAFTIYYEDSKKAVNDNKKQILRCFQAECGNLLVNLSVKNIDSIRSRLSKSFDSLNSIFKIDGIALSSKLLELKLDELNLTYTFQLKQQQEKEQQKAIKEQMIEEEKVRREIERQKAKIDKDCSQFNNEVKKLMNYMQKTSSDVEKQLYIDKIKELENKLQQLETDKKNVLEREANAKAGFVYVISNIGSFGEDIYKIGMTRRLEPMDRIKELSSASVPFEFDVHAMIFSDNAPELENLLHKHFEKQSVNRVNLRKEFFHVSLDEIEKVVHENFNDIATFTKVPVAQEYRQTISIIASETK